MNDSWDKLKRHLPKNEGNGRFDAFIPFGCKTAVLAALAALTLTAQGGQGTLPEAAAAAAMPTTAVKAAPAAASGPAIADKFRKQLQTPGRLPEAFGSLSGSIGQAGPYYGGLMVLYLENAMNDQLAAMTKLFVSEPIQASIAAVYNIGDGMKEVMGKTKDAKLKTLLKEAAASGYKLETAEGTFYPIVDYRRLQPFKGSVSADIRDYIDIMTAESDQAKLKDASLTIGYQELVRRTMAQEKFVAKYPHSNRAAKIEKLFGQYESLTFRGSNNTPLFRYDNHGMQPNAKKGYALMLTYHDASSSPYLTLLDEFMKLAEKSGFKESDEIAAFVDKNLPGE